MKDQANDKRSPIIAVALLLTASFLGAFGWLLSRTDTCPDGWWLWHRLSCLEPNELGDTFAGAFAPVAFVWLVAAVLLQRNELAAQRQELRESRAVAKEQVAETRNNVAFMGQQTQLLQAREKFERQEQIDADFRKYIEALNDFMESSFRVIKITSPIDDGYGGMVDHSIVVLRPDPNPDSFKRLQSYSSALSKCSIEAYRTVEVGGAIHYVGLDELKSIKDHFEVLQKNAEKISDALQIRFQIIKADDAAWRIDALTNLLTKTGKPIPEDDF